MCRTIDALLKRSDITAQWRAILSARSTEAWAAIILPLVPTRVKHMLAAPCPPTAADWRTLAWQDSSLFGVYAWVLKRGNGPGLNPLREENYVYIGSATNYSHGLSGRALQHRKGHYWDGPKLYQRIKQRGLSRTTGHFATLMVMEVASPKSNDIIKAREFVLFTEAIFTIWFGALVGTESVTGRTRDHDRLCSLSPWDHPQQFNYKGLCSHNPLVLDLNSDQESADSPEQTDLGQSSPVVGNRATEG